MKNPEVFTLSAGPTMATHRTLAALGKPILYHYDPLFLETFRRTQEKAARVFKTKNDMILMQGEAIVALEGAARSLVKPGMQVLNLVQGVFGKGMGYWLTSFGAEVFELEVAYNEAVDPAAVEDFLKSHPGIELVTLVHSETPSGTITDCKAIGPIAKKYGALTLIDAVSSIGGLEFETDEWQLDVVVTGAQKCLAGPPGIGMMSVSPAAWDRIENNPAAPRASYVSLLDWKEKWLDGGVFPYTPSVSDVHGLESVLDQVLEEGLDEAIARHTLAAEATRAGVVAMGLELWAASPGIAANCVTSVRLPEHLDHVEVRTHVREKYGVMLSSGQGAGNLMRLAHMGPTASGMYPIVGLAALGRGLKDLGMDVNVGAGIDAALEVLSAAA
ncbi:MULTISPECIES: alanine--glyoxylate aminotransferase family protein [unclassified Leucobacter]|uniref:pyridoxal-phosphate-dependent aminotransferase family protein n=1 Tax=unclassified Leucobacter TaxID=2621730 RepID=UPI00165E2230|nr:MULTISPECIES: alanine--glyoxylate aminotransferase family protein [unclassified Leucobacter]MBC9935866.1 alanine--glyoxylate aminotransferase family protein [Leucobacter sp. cx-87]